VAVIDFLYNWIIHTLEPLYLVLFKSRYFFIDVWSFVHLMNGFLVMSFLIWRKTRRLFLALFSIQIAWELLEMTFTFLALRVFKPEILPDQVTDIVIGLFGGLLAYSLIPRSSRKVAAEL
jgi:hypothetical protein